MNGPQRHFGMDQKAAILKRCLVDQVPLSDLCDEYGIKPNEREFRFPNGSKHPMSLVSCSFFLK